MNKNAIELSVNFLVMFIIGIVVFGMGIYIVQQIATQAFESDRYTQDYLDSQIESISCTARDKVCVTNNFQQLRRGEVGFIGLFIYNYNETANNATFTITPEPVRAYDVDDAQMTEMYADIPDLQPNEPRIIVVNEDVTIPAKQQQRIGLGVSIPDDAPSGRYVWNIEITGLEPIVERVTFYVR